MINHIRKKRKKIPSIFITWSRQKKRSLKFLGDVSNLAIYNCDILDGILTLNLHACMTQYPVSGSNLKRCNKTAVLILLIHDFFHKNGVYIK